MAKQETQENESKKGWRERHKVHWVEDMEAKAKAKGEANAEEMKQVGLPDKVKDAVGDRKVIGFVTGFGLFKKLTATIIMTESEVIFYDPKLTGANKTEIPFAQIIGATYFLQMGVPTFSVTTQSGKQELVLSGSKKDTHEPALNLFMLLKDKLSELAAVPISETHNKGIMKETWSFYTPPQLAVAQAKQAIPTEAKTTDIPSQIKQLADLKEAGILSQEEFESKKKELLARL